MIFEESWYDIFYLTIRYLVVMNAALRHLIFICPLNKTQLRDMATGVYLLVVLFLSEADVSLCLRLKLIHTSEVSYKLMPFDKDMKPCLVDTRLCLGGVTRQSKVIKLLRESEPNVLVLDAGNYLEPNYWYAMTGTKALVDAMTSINYDAMVNVFMLNAR